MNLPTIPGANLNKVYDFYEGLVASVRASETVEKLADFKEYTRMTLESYQRFGRILYNWTAAGKTGTFLI